ncbi:hypothetical protein BpHYR1_030181, partial [Brachionus plicatilis]
AIGPKWNEWVKGLDNYLKWINVVEEDRRKAALLHHAGVEVMRIYETMEKNIAIKRKTEIDGVEREIEDEVIDDYEAMKKKLQNHFNPRKNTYYERLTFRQARQEEGEAIASFATRLRNLAKYCGFHDIETEIISQIVEGSNNKDIISRVLVSKEGLKLDDLLDWRRTREVANNQIKDLKKDFNSLTVNLVENKSNFLHRNDGFRKCFKCGLKFPHTGDCPAKSKTCNKCGTIGHFAKKCPNNMGRETGDGKVNSLMQNIKEASKDEWLFTVDGEGCLPTTELLLKKIPVKFIVDTGSTINILDERQFEKIKNFVKIRSSNRKIFAFKSKDPLPLVCGFDVTVTIGAKIVDAEFVVVKGGSSSLI